ncbi:hypothetical protein JOE58_002424 [Curtobacterium luteum]|uniref:Maltokinase N-terminal cap domain-containing protein n=1 Tax=Curtobacterium luteum TaxID=33881 RepID=A0A8H9KXM5_9MICO|nr:MULTISPECIES: hypothetical protein [Curtobacterium]MBM7803173.1 hypothetical protein [Curtobacterium luteum]NUU50822.1 hypothetical protein [Curtobacterium luteum]GGK94695.1 hypothetical protein GCM10009769_10820 [Curtobacterium luteum]
MAIIHEAVLRPSKAEALAVWLPLQPWSGVTPGEAVEVVGRFRFDDPAGEVGVETIVVRTGSGRLLHAPLTYRAAPLRGADAFLVTEMDHSVLGRRWVYDATGDPVYADVVRRAIATGGHEAELERADGAGSFDKEATAVGSGSAPSSPTVTAVDTRTEEGETTIATGHGELVVLRVVGSPVPSGETLRATWATGSGVLVVLV